MSNAALLPVARQAASGFSVETCGHIAGCARLFRWSFTAKIGQSDYTAFGQRNEKTTQETVAQRYTFTGRESSANAAAGAPMYYRNRSYSAGLGRFGRRDPVFDGGNQFNAYAAMGGNAVRHRDPMGLSYFDFAQCNSGQCPKAVTEEDMKKCLTLESEQRPPELNNAVRAMLLSEMTKGADFNMEPMRKYWDDNCRCACNDFARWAKLMKLPPKLSPVHDFAADQRRRQAELQAHFGAVHAIEIGGEIYLVVAVAAPVAIEAAIVWGGEAAIPAVSSAGRQVLVWTGRSWKWVAATAPEVGGAVNKWGRQVVQAGAGLIDEGVALTGRAEDVAVRQAQLIRMAAALAAAAAQRYSADAWRGANKALGQGLDVLSSGASRLGGAAGNWIMRAEQFVAAHGEALGQVQEHIEMETIPEYVPALQERLEKERESLWDKPPSDRKVTAQPIAP